MTELLYQSGQPIRTGDQVLLHSLPAVVEFVVDQDRERDDWDRSLFGNGIMLREASCFGRLFIPADHLPTYQDLVFRSRAEER